MQKKLKKIAIIDFGLGNISSVQAACEFAGADTVVLERYDKYAEREISGLILPGVGAYQKAMETIKENGLSDTIQDVILKKKPVMAICLGHQLLFEKSLEFGTSFGLGILSGDVIPIEYTIRQEAKPRVPNVGWFKLTLNPERQEVEWNNPPFSNLNTSSHFYFTHSLVAVPKDKSTVQTSTCVVETKFVSSVGVGPVFGCQFHPEKSHRFGMELMRRFVEI